MSSSAPIISAVISAPVTAAPVTAAPVTVASDTWGIPGPAFLVIYAVLAVASLLLALAVRSGMFRTVADRDTTPLTAVEVGMLV